MARVRRIAAVAVEARALRRMTEDPALCIYSASASCAWICALVVDARPRLGAITVGHTFGTAFDVRIAKVFGHARARGGTLALIAHGIRAAWTRRAGFRSCDDS